MSLLPGQSADVGFEVRFEVPVEITIEDPNE
jgi:hypothetical protein